MWSSASWGHAPSGSSMPTPPTYVLSGRGWSIAGEQNRASANVRKSPVYIGVDTPSAIAAEDAYLRGRVLYGPGTREDALRAWDVAVRLDPTEPRYWRERGEALHRLKRFDDALASLDRALEFDPRNSGAWRIRASVLAYQGRFEAALNAAEHPLAIDGPPNAWSAKIGALRRLGREAEAEGAVSPLREALEELWRRRRVSAE